MRPGFFIAIGILLLCGLAIMLWNYVERPTNDSGPTGAYGRTLREHHTPWPPENERLSHKFRRWWEL